jgi:hypothetical protein
VYKAYARATTADLDSLNAELARRGRQKVGLPSGVVKVPACAP